MVGNVDRVFAFGAVGAAASQAGVWTFTIRQPWQGCTARLES